MEAKSIIMLPPHPESVINAILGKSFIPTFINMYDRMAFSGRSITPLYKSIMFFIDGGYIRPIFKNLFNTDDINFPEFVKYISVKVSSPYFKVMLQRVYYYDANVQLEVDQSKHKELNQYFEKIRKYDYHEVKLGRLIKTNDGYRQKGVDVLIAIDMILKAYESHYDIAVLVAGDDDFEDVVKTVKNSTGKQVYGAYYPKNTSMELIESFDKRIILDETTLKQFTNLD